MLVCDSNLTVGGTAECDASITLWYCWNCASYEGFNLCSSMFATNTRTKYFISARAEIKDVIKEHINGIYTTETGIMKFTRYELITL